MKEKDDQMAILNKEIESKQDEICKKDNMISSLLSKEIESGKKVKPLLLSTIENQQDSNLSILSSIDIDFQELSNEEDANYKRLNENEKKIEAIKKILLKVLIKEMF